VLQRDFGIVNFLAAICVPLGFPFRKERLEITGADVVDRNNFDAFIDGKNPWDEAVLLEDSRVEMMVRGELFLFEDIDCFSSYSLPSASIASLPSLPAITRKPVSSKTCSSLPPLS
jgi:hypothetical protein